MTNTRITDPEILERRYPVVLREFRCVVPQGCFTRRAHTRMACSLRPGSGGSGTFRGGDGVVREIEVRLFVAFTCTLFRSCS
jgi:5-oxoprolinase (ATP-hydrolysing)